VDDAIVMIENIARHWGMKDGRSRQQAAIEAVAEVGNPTIIATLTVVAPCCRCCSCRADGALYGAHPDQRLGGDGVQLLRGGGHRALADDPLCAPDAGAWAGGEDGGWARSMPAMPPA
jgi:hypothetical protein